MSLTKIYDDSVLELVKMDNEFSLIEKVMSQKKYHTCEFVASWVDMSYRYVTHYENGLSRFHYVYIIEAMVHRSYIFSNNKYNCTHFNARI